MKFSTLNESDLHHSLKILYSETYDGKTEVEQNGYVYDIVTKNGNIIEIQTANLAKLLPKIKETISKGHNIKLVHPVVTTRKIALYNDKGELISKRKSPKKVTIYDSFKELTGIYPILLDPHFSLELVEVEITEERLRTEEPVQTLNQRRRYKKNWLKTNKKLENIVRIIKLNKSEDYIKLLPALPEVFCAKDINTAANIKTGNLIIWVLSRMKIIEYTETKQKSKYYKIM